MRRRRWIERWNERRNEMEWEIPQKFSCRSVSQAMNGISSSHFPLPLIPTRSLTSYVIHNFIQVLVMSFTSWQCHSHLGSLTSLRCCSNLIQYSYPSTDFDNVTLFLLFSFWLWRWRSHFVRKILWLSVVSRHCCLYPGTVGQNGGN